MTKVETMKPYEEMTREELLALRKELKAIYNAPYADVEAKLNELIEMVKLPFKIADDFIGIMFLP